MTGLLITTAGLVSLFSPSEEDAEEEKKAVTSNGKANGAAKNGTATANGASTSGSHSRHHHHRHEKLGDFHAFRRQYITVYLVIMLADWMQGTHMYTLYLSYGVNVSTLFLTGFLSGALFAPFLGSFVDKFGRKRSCIVYCVLEIIINVILSHLFSWDSLLILVLTIVLSQLLKLRRTRGR